jgi:glycerol-3-phosphate acyltransferase PlsY
MLMNRVVASAFASILSLVHLAVILGLGGLTIMFFSDNKRQINQLSYMIGVSPEAFILVIIAIWIGYVLVMGFLATIIAMNENLERLQKSVEEMAKRLP